uniref:DDE-1 domain-containing protein n=1 Tax=Chlorocebus sabaeus TaxID=60711 RepID=A0A0D9R1T8_CHLSB
GKAASVVGEVASYPEDLAEINDEGGYVKQKIFNIDKTSLYWKKKPSKTFIAIQTKSVHCFKSSKDRLTLSRRLMQLANSENPRAIKNYTKSALSVLSVNGTTKPWFTEYFKSTVETYCSEKKIPFKILLPIDDAPGHPRALREMYKEMNVVFMLLTQYPCCCPWIKTFKSYYLRNTFHKAIAGIDSDSLDRYGQSKLKAFAILDAVKNICKSWEEVKIALMGIWKKLSPILMDKFEELKTSVEEVTADVVQTARESELEVEPEYVTELLQSYDQTWMDEELLLMDEQTGFFEIESTPGEDGVNIVEMTTSDFKYYINLVDKVAGFQRTDFNFERSSTVGKLLSNSIICYREIFCESKSQLMQKTLLSSLRDQGSLYVAQARVQWLSPMPSTLSQDFPSAKRLLLAEGSD